MAHVGKEIRFSPSRSMGGIPCRDQFLLNLVSVRDVNEERDMVCNLIIAIPDRGNNLPYRKYFPIFSPVPNLTLPIAMGFQLSPKFPIERLPVQPGFKQTRIVANHLGSRIASDSCKSRIDR